MGNVPSDLNPNSAGLDDNGIAAARRTLEASRQSAPWSVTETSPTPRGDLLGGLHDLPADSFPGFEIIKEIHRGGQGIVYLAIQHATKRKVAIKVMREGPFADRADMARFEREVLVLGQLQHSNIVTIHDSGTASGHFYFVMDYISGQPLDVYLASRKLSIAETLKLFALICEAVSAAHLKGVVHRDLKPGNIRVDAEGQPHILDFGLAKVAASEADARAMTMTGQFIGSLPWASPEQAEGNPSKIDLRTDVYSLGVILYQMLTSRFPYDVVGNMRDVLERILHAEPVRPSTLRKAINDEVETIVLKCLCKERERRYQTAGELARDIGHYLAGEPIEAKRDSTWYVVKKSLRRHRGSVAFAATILVLLTGAWLGMAFLYGQVRLQRDRAVGAAQAESVARHEAQDSAARARTEAGRAGAVVSLFNRMIAADPYELKRPDYTVRELLDDFAVSLRDDLRDEPEVEATIRGTMAAAYRGLALYEKCEEQLGHVLALQRSVHGERSEEVAEAIGNLGMLALDRGDLERADGLLRDSLLLTRELVGNEHPSVARALTGLGMALGASGKLTEAEAVQREALELRRRLQGEDHPEFTYALNNLAVVLDDLGKLAEAEPLHREALELRRRHFGEDHPLVASDLNNLGTLLHQKGAFAEAEELHRQALVIRRARLGPVHPEIAMSLSNLGSACEYQGRLGEAETHYREALDMARDVFGEVHPHVATTLNNLGLVLQKQGALAEAARIHHEALTMRRTLLGANHPDVAQSLGNLAAVHQAAGEHAQAVDLFREALVILSTKIPPEHTAPLTVRRRLAKSLMFLAQFDKAEALFVENGGVALGKPNVPTRIQDDAMKDIVMLYEKWHEAEPGKGYDAKAAEWSAKLAAWQATTQPATLTDSATQPADRRQAGRSPLRAD